MRKSVHHFKEEFMGTGHSPGVYDQVIDLGQISFSSQRKNTHGPASSADTLAIVYAMAIGHAE